MDQFSDPASEPQPSASEGRQRERQRPGRELPHPRRATAVDADVTVWTEEVILAVARDIGPTGGQDAWLGALARAGNSIANHWPADRVANLLQHMAATDTADACDHLLDAVAAAGGSYPASTAHVAGALATRGARELAARYLDRVVPQMTDDAVEALAMFLDAGRQDNLAVYVLATAAAARGPSAVIGYMDTLRSHGDHAAADALVLMIVRSRPEQAGALLKALRSERRTTDADHVLNLVASLTAEQCSAVLLTLRSADAASDAEALTDALAQHPLTAIAQSLAAAGLTRPAVLAALGARLRGRSPREFAEAIIVLRSRGSASAADTLMTTVTATTPETVCAVVLDLADVGNSRDAATLLERFASLASPAQVMTATLWLDGVDHGRALMVLWTVLAIRNDSNTVMQALRRAGRDVFIERALSELIVTLSVPRLVGLVPKLSQQRIDGDEAILAAAARSDCLALCSALHTAGHHQLAYRLAERRAEFGIR